MVASRLATLIAAVAAAFCPHGPKRSGSLAATADALIPREAVQTCVQVLARPDVAYQTGYIECWVEPDTAVLVRMSENGEVEHVTVRLRSAQFDSTEQELGARYGPSVSGCPTTGYQVRHWRTPSFQVVLFRGLADTLAFLAYVNDTFDRSETCHP